MWIVEPFFSISRSVSKLIKRRFSHLNIFVAFTGPLISRFSVFLWTYIIRYLHQLLDYCCKENKTSINTKMFSNELWYFDRNKYIYFLQNIYALPFSFPLLTWLTISFALPQHSDERSTGGNCNLHAKISLSKIKTLICVWRFHFQKLNAQSAYEDLSFKN